MPVGPQFLLWFWDLAISEMRMVPVCHKQEGSKAQW